MKNEKNRYLNLDQHIIKPFDSSLDDYKLRLKLKHENKKTVEQAPVSIEIGDVAETDKVSFSSGFKPRKKMIKIRIRPVEKVAAEKKDVLKDVWKEEPKPIKMHLIEKKEEKEKLKENKEMLREKKETKEKIEKRETDKEKEIEKKVGVKKEKEKREAERKEIEKQKSAPIKKDQITEIAEKLAEGLLTHKKEEKKTVWKEEPRVRIKAAEGISLPEIIPSEKIKIEDLRAEETRLFKTSYALIPKNPKKGERVFAYANIKWDPKQGEITYTVVEPELSEEERKLLSAIKNFIEEKVDISFGELRKKEAITYISSMFDDALDYFKTEFSEEKREILKYYVFRDFIGLGAIEPLMNDPRIEDISCDGTNIPIYIYHRDPRLGALKTNIGFKNKEELDSFVMKISERCGKTISVARPLLDGALPDGSRIQATLSSDVATRGSNFTIRKFTEKPLTPTDMLELGTLDLLSTAYLWFSIEHGASILISGTTATGKTTLLNVLSFFINPQAKIVSIEDTPELRLAHTHWIPEVARSPISTEKTEVDMFYLLKESLRQRPDYIIVGEVRGKEAYVLFQQIATGHPGLSTIHAESFPKLIDRLTTKPIELPMSSIENIDIIIFLQRIKQGKKYIRRVSDITEVIGYDRDAKEPVINRVFVWDPKTDKVKTVGKSFSLKKISERLNLTESEIRKEIEKRAKVLEWMVKHGLSDYRDVTQIINLYHTYPDKLLEKIRE
ncbi:MAG: type IV secretion system protein VirB11 [Candidatus Aenigmarchaeota archaeon ex4484_14]|nr:MAG: type IV secretion system protein VirB11 [Candidatus Aenigmarchaeota archaeon ex4484_14]